MDNKITISPMAKEDAKACQALDQARFLISPYSLKAFNQCLISPSEKVFVLKEGQTIIGFIMISLTPEEGEIYRLAVSEDKQGNHYGEQLLNYAHDFMKNRGISVSFLEVRKSNLKAIGLYLKQGYVTYRVRKNYYSNLEDAICMKKGL